MQFLINGRRLTVIQPKDVDEVIDMYIEQGTNPPPSFVRRLWTDVWEIRTIKSLSSSLYWYCYICQTLGLTSHIAGMLLPKLCAGRLDRDPYWCRIWPSAIALAEEVCHTTLCFPVHYLLQQTKEFNG